MQFNSMTRRTALSTFAGGALAFGQKTRKPMNVLFIVSDDLNNAVSVSGDPVTKTPNLDRLARRGVTFDRSYCQYPLCQPSRTSFLSGLRPETTRVWTLETPTREYIGDAVMLPELFRKNGYFTAHAGKIFHTGEKAEDPRSWDRELRDYGKTPKPDQILRADKSPGPKGHSFEWNMLKTPDEQMPDGVFARTSVKWLEEVVNAGKPFFMATGFRRPHAPYAAPKKYFDMYPPESIPLPKTGSDDWHRLLPAAINHIPPDKPLTPQVIREHIAAYHACTTFMDAQLGLVLDAMDRLKLWDNTVVSFCGDNGYLLGEHGGLWHKNSLFEQGARVPLIFYAPGMKASGRHSSRLVELVDLYPTITDLCGMTPPSNLEGTSFRPLLDDPNRPWKSGAFTMQGRDKERTEAAKNIEFLGNSIRTERYRYIEWDGGKQGIELYDHEMDPWEETNLAGNPKAAKIEADLKERLRRGWKSALPTS